MAVRPARFVDVPVLAALLADSHTRSIYANTATFDDRAAKQMLTASIQRHGHDTLGGTRVLVSETDGQVRGLIIGVIDKIYPCLAELVVTDLMFVFAPNAAPGDALKMVRALIVWAENNPRVIEVMLGAANTMGDEWERVGALYERCGLTRCGGMYQKEITR